MHAAMIAYVTGNRRAFPTAVLIAEGCGGAHLEQ